jgi:hypothetical protein
MGWISAMAVLVVIAVAAGGLWAFVVTARKRPRARGPFLAGVLCGVTVGMALTARRRGLNAFGASTLNAVLGLPRPGTGISLDGAAARALTAAAAVVRRGTAWSRLIREAGDRNRAGRGVAAYAESSRRDSRRRWRSNL